MDHSDSGEAPVDIRPIGLRVLSGPGAGGSRVFAQPTIMVGRSADCTFQIDDPTVSRLHFSLAFVRGRWELTDAGSSSGTAVNGKPGGDVGSLCVLHDGDRISAGRSVVEVSIESERSEAADLDIEPDPACSPVGTTGAAPPSGDGRSPRRTWLPWLVGAIVISAIAVFAATSRCGAP